MKHIKDFKVFDLNFVPEIPINRPEMDKIAKAVLKYEKSRIPTHIFAFGSRGCGKTVTMKYLQRLFDTSSMEAKLLYVNVREHNTSFKMFAQLLGASPRGVSLSELFARFKGHFSAPTVLILDEIDFISEKDKDKEILYLLSRCSENYMLILLANNPKFVSDIDTRTRSSLNPAPLHFKNYDAIQMLKILQQRAEKGLSKFSHSLLNEISALAVKHTNSDVRVALKTLYYMATEKGNDLQECFQNAQRDLTADLICDLNYNNLLVLKAALKTPNGLVKEIYEKYTRLCSLKNERPFSYPYFYNNLSYLQSLGLILLASTKVGRTYTNRISLLFQPELLQTAFESKFES
ncbi:MAG: orc1/cdc6 family replication initiation protein [Gammaproteobacteria bacterium]|nr:orc1/cdc6 family replication initiation protein [Gammaproteobacteria bacterium]